MTTNIPGCYDFCTDVPCTIFGMTDETVVMFQDFQCQVDILTSLSRDGFDLEATCTDVLKDGKSLRNGDALAKALRTAVMMQVDKILESGGPLFDQVREAEGLILSGLSNDPDQHWVRGW